MEHRHAVCLALVSLLSFAVIAQCTGNIFNLCCWPFIRRQCTTFFHTSVELFGLFETSAISKEPESKLPIHPQVIPAPPLVAEVLVEVLVETLGVQQAAAVAQLSQVAVSEPTAWVL